MREPGEIGAHPFADAAGHGGLVRDQRGRRRVARQRLRRRDRLARDHLPQPGGREATARVGVRDRPVGAERKHRAGIQQVAHPERAGGALGPEPLVPRAGAVGADRGHVDRLHRRDDARARQRRHEVVRERLQVLDPVPYTWSRPRAEVGADREAHGGVADGVGRELEAGAREAVHHVRHPLRVGPERRQALAASVGRLEPGSAGVDHAVGEELGHAAAPQPAGGADQRQQRVDPLVADVGRDPLRHAQPQRQLLGAFEIAQELVRAGIAVDHVPAGEAERVQLTHQLDVPRPQLRPAHPRRGPQHEVVRRPLAQLSGRHAARVDHDRRGVRELHRARDLCVAERVRRGERGVQVESRTNAAMPGSASAIAAGEGAASYSSPHASSHPRCGLPARSATSVSAGVRHARRSPRASSRHPRTDGCASPRARGSAPRPARRSPRCAHRTRRARPRPPPRSSRPARRRPTRTAAPDRACERAR